MVQGIATAETSLESYVLYSTGMRYGVLLYTPGVLCMRTCITPYCVEWLRSIRKSNETSSTKPDTFVCSLFVALLSRFAPSDPVLW